MNVRSLDTGAGPFRPLSNERSAARAFRGARVAVCGFAVLAFALGALGSVARPVLAQIAGDVPEELDTVGITEHVDEKIPLDLEFVDEDGREIKLGDYFDGERPVLLTLNYYGCPMLCGLQLNGMVAGLSDMDWTIGDEFEVVTVSINPLETPSLAKAKKQNYLREYGRPEAANGWHFLTGKRLQIDALAEATGFGYEFVPETGEYSHAAAAFVLTPDGRLSRYLYGVVYEPKTVKYSLVEAADGRIGSPLDQIILFCFHYDAEAGAYTPVVMNIMRVGALLTAVVLGAVVGTFWLREHRAKGVDTAGGEL